MHNELTNLLPLERQRALRRDYFVRLSVVLLILLTMLTLAAAVLLAPTYVFLVKSIQAKEVRLANIEAALSSSDEAALSAQLNALSASTATLTTLANTASVSEAMRAVLALPRPGIVLSGFNYVPAAGKTLRALAVSGTAATRDTLRSYQLALESAPFVRSADLPVSAYAKDADITFTITVTLAP